MWFLPCRKWLPEPAPATPSVSQVMPGPAVSIRHAIQRDGSVIAGRDRQGLRSVRRESVEDVALCVRSGLEGLGGAVVGGERQGAALWLDLEEHIEGVEWLALALDLQSAEHAGRGTPCGRNGSTEAVVGHLGTAEGDGERLPRPFRVPEDAGPDGPPSVHLNGQEARAPIAVVAADACGRSW